MAVVAKRAANGSNRPKAPLQVCFHGRAVNAGMRSFAERVRCDRLRPKTERDACATAERILSASLAQALGSMVRSKKAAGPPLPADTCPLLRQWAAAVGGGRIGCVAGHGREQIVIVPVAFAFRRLLDLKQIEIRHHATIGLHMPVRTEGVVDRKLLQLLGDRDPKS